MQLIDTIFDLLEPGGTLVLETHFSLGDDLVARYIAGSFWGDMSWFWLPTLPALHFERCYTRAGSARSRFETHLWLKVRIPTIPSERLKVSR